MRAKSFSGFSPDAEASLQNYSWPDNVRELLNVIERAALIHEGTGVVTSSTLAIPARTARSDIPEPRLQLVPSPFAAPSASGAIGYMKLKKQWAENFEREYLVSALSRHGGNVSAAAREAELDRSNFLRLLRKYGLKSQQYRKAA